VGPSWPEARFPVAILPLARQIASVVGCGERCCGREVVPCGSWATPVTSAVVVESAVGLSEVRVDGADVVWSESRPDEGGRIQLVRRSGDGAMTELLPVGQNGAHRSA